MGYGYHMMDRFGYFPWLGGVFMGLLFLLIIGGIIFFVLFSMKKKNTREKDESSALEILKKRYANGEITKEEYEEIKRNIL